MVGMKSNIIVFGQTGAGKSSLINMLAGETRARVSSLPTGCTLSSESFEISPDETRTTPYTFWDTAGLNEADGGTVPAKKAMDKLCDLVGYLRSVNLIVYCVYASRFTDIVQVNYDLFYGIVCEKKVPIVLVVTGLENEDDMDNWLVRHRKVIKWKTMMKAFKGYACVTTTKGRGNMHIDIYLASAKKVWALVEQHGGEPYSITPRRREDIRRKMERHMKNYNSRGLLARIFSWF